MNNYTPTRWIGGQTIATADKMNNIENGITESHNRLDFVNEQLNTIESKKADKVVTNNLQQQINNLVIDENGEVDNIEISQARTDIFGNSFSVLNTRFQNLEKIITNENVVVEFSDWVHGAIGGGGTDNTLTTYIKSSTYHSSTVGDELILYIRNGYKVAIAWYNETKTFLKREDFITDTSAKFKVISPFYRLCVGLNDSTIIDVSASNNLTIEKNNRNNYKILENVYDSSVISDWEGGAILNANGELTHNNAYIRTSLYHFIDKNKKIKVKTKNGYKARIHFYDLDEKYVGSSGYVTDEDVCVLANNFKVLLTLDEKSTIYLDSSKNLKLNYLLDYTKSQNKLEGKTIYSFGDSLVAGHYSGEGILDGLVKQNNMIYTKYARNGFTVIGTESPSIYYQISNASSVVPDFVVFDGLTNDAYDNVVSTKLGELTDSYTGGYDTTTFTGSFENICYTLRTKYQNSNIIYVAPHKMPNRTKNAQDVLQRVAKEVCAKWSIPIVDIYNKGQINTYIEGLRNEYSYNNQGETSGGNGTHLTGEGYNKFYSPMIKSKMLELI